MMDRMRMPCLAAARPVGTSQRPPPVALQAQPSQALQECSSRKKLRSPQKRSRPRSLQPSSDSGHSSPIAVGNGLPDCCAGSQPQESWYTGVVALYSEPSSGYAPSPSATQYSYPAASAIARFRIRWKDASLSIADGKCSNSHRKLPDTSNFGTASARARNSPQNPPLSPPSSTHASTLSSYAAHSEQHWTGKASHSTSISRQKAFRRTSARPNATQASKQHGSEQQRLKKVAHVKRRFSRMACHHTLYFAVSLWGCFSCSISLGGTSVERSSRSIPSTASC